MITVSGTATKREGTSSNPFAGVTIAAFKRGDSTPIAMTTTDTAGNYSLTLTTNGVAVDGYIKGTASGYIDTYLYPPKALAESYDMASINMINQSTLDLLSGLLCKKNQDAAKGLVATIVADANRMPIAGATVTATPAAEKYCYNQTDTNGMTLPKDTATITDTDGIGYMINVPAGEVTVGAMKSGMTFVAHPVEARAGALTTTVIQP